MKKKYLNQSFVPPEADEFLDVVKQEFSQSFEVQENFISDWLRHHNNSKGKWIRARLALASGGLLGLSSQTYIKWAVVCELIHSASLLHDDICDGDLTRRGKTSLWKEFGIPAAVCTGDYLIAESFRKLTEIEQGWHQNILLKLLSCSVKEIIFGQSLDVSFNHLDINDTQLRKIAIEKTAPLIAMPIMGMFQCKELTEDECSALKEISNELGLAYQYLNDIENIIGSEQEASSDLLKGRPNLMAIKILKNLSNAKKKKIINEPKKLGNLISRKDFDESRDEISEILINAMSNIHRLPIIIQPVIKSLKDEINKRLQLL
ncbi:polyprenyl synthetase family protein [Methylophilaceae bacterium]|jgi:geranylgeranyl diphosphate synthase type I|nr:polyprenyl synthetase family protein [Methylophilaceae bacterium]